MTVRQIMTRGVRRLEELGVETPRLDASVLLGEALGVSRERLYLIPEKTVSPEEEGRYFSFIDSRARGWPVSYIRGRKEFYGIDFFVDPRVLVPRPDTELLVDEALALIRRREVLPRVHDLCTGTGCVPIVLKKMISGLEITTSDFSPEVEEVFLKNCRTILGMPLPFVLSDLFENLSGPFDLVTANPPYIPLEEYEEMKNRNWPEPELALLGGEDGLDVIRRLVSRAPDYLSPRGELLIESAFDSMEKLYYILEQNHFRQIRVIKDLGGRDRVIYGQRG